MWFLFRLLLAAPRAMTRSRQDLVLENVALRHQLEVYRRSRRRLPLTDHDRRLWSTLARSWAGWRTAVLFVHGDTVVRWHRTAWRRHWARKSRRRGPGGPRLDRETQAPPHRSLLEQPGAWRLGQVTNQKPAQSSEYRSALVVVDESVVDQGLERIERLTYRQRGSTRACRRGQPDIRPAF